MFPELRPYKADHQIKETYHALENNTIGRKPSDTNPIKYDIENRRVPFHLTPDISLLKLQYKNLEIKYKHLQSLLKDSQDLVDVQTKEIAVLKQLAVKNRNYYEDSLKDTSVMDFGFHSPAFSDSKNSNTIITPNNKLDSVCINIQPTTNNVLKSKSGIDLPLTNSNNISRTQLQQNSNVILKSNSKSSIDLNRNSFQNSSNSKSSNQSGSPKIKPKLPYPFNTHQTQLKKDTLEKSDLLDHERKINTYVDGIYKSQSKEFIVETVVEKGKNDAILDFDRIIFDTKNPKWINLDTLTNLNELQFSGSTNLKNYDTFDIDETIEKLNISDFDIEKINSEFKSCYDDSRSHSPSKSMLIRERDSLEEELLAQYELMRKMQTRGQFNK